MIARIIRKLLRYVEEKGGYLKAVKALRMAWYKNGSHVMLYRIRQFLINENTTRRIRKNGIRAKKREKRQLVGDLVALRKELALMKYRPLISIILPVYNTPEKFLRACIDSVEKQVYPHWELCIVDDASSEISIRQILEEYKKTDRRIHCVFHKNNGHISRASNTAFYLAKGEYVALLDHDDMLSPYALLEAVRLLNKYPDADYIYTDEDKIDEDGESFIDPYYKPDWSPDTFLSIMYTCHLSIIRRSLMENIGGFRIGFEGAQDYDLVLRLTESTQKIYHIPKTLYHWRVSPTSTAAGTHIKEYASDAGIRAREDALLRRGIKAAIIPAKSCDGVNVLYITEKTPMISIIIPTRDHGDDLLRCLKSIYEKTTWLNYEIILVDNGSTDPISLRLFSEYEKNHSNFRILRLDIPFNYSRLNNTAAKYAKGELLLFLNNDTVVITPEWLDIMAGQAIQSHTGAVGAKLLYPNETIQHCGVVGHRGHVAGHAFLNVPRDTVGYFNRTHITHNFLAVTAACMMVQKSKFMQTSGFNEIELVVAFNDVDINIQLLELGYYNVLRPDVLLYHYESISRGYEDTPEKVARFQSEIEYMRKKWARKYLDHDPFYNPNLNPEAYFNVL